MALTNDYIKHHIFLDRLARGIAQDYKTTFKAISDFIEREISANPSVVEILRLRDEIQRRIDNATASTVTQLEQFAVYEGKFNKRVLEKHTGDKITLPTAEILSAIAGVAIATSFNKQASGLTSSFNAFANKKTADYMQVMDDSIILQQEKEVRTNNLDRLSQGQFSTQATALVGLGTLAVATNTLKLIQNENNIKMVQWLAILDDHVCPYCRGLHGRVFTIQDVPANPAHGNCRCSVVPYDE